MKTIAASLALIGGVLLVPAGAQSYTKATTKQKVAQPVTTATTPSGGFFGGGDDCSSPTTIVGAGTFDFNTGTTGAEGQVDPLCYAFGTSGIENDVWFKWIAAGSGMVTAETCGGTATDTKMAVYGFQNGGCPADGTALDCNDDTCGLQSSISWNANFGGTYSIQIGTFPGATNSGGGTFTVGLASPADNYVYCLAPDGSGSQDSCPCGNNSTFGGCNNSTGLGGALLLAGSSSIGANDLGFVLVQAVPNQSVVVFSANNIYRSPLGDGLRCAGDSAIRLSMGVADATGAYATASGLIALENNPQPGDVRRYQGWYRDPSGPCGNGSNTTQGWSLTFTP